MVQFLAILVVFDTKRLRVGTVFRISFLKHPLSENPIAES